MNDIDRDPVIECASAPCSLGEVDPTYSGLDRCAPAGNDRPSAVSPPVDAKLAEGLRSADGKPAIIMAEDENTGS